MEGVRGWLPRNLAAGLIVTVMAVATSLVGGCSMPFGSTGADPHAMDPRAEAALWRASEMEYNLLRAAAAFRHLTDARGPGRLTRPQLDAYIRFAAALQQIDEALPAFITAMITLGDTGPDVSPSISERRWRFVILLRLMYEFPIERFVPSEARPSFMPAAGWHVEALRDEWEDVAESFSSPVLWADGEPQIVAAQTAAQFGRRVSALRELFIARALLSPRDLSGHPAVNKLSARELFDAIIEHSESGQREE